MSLLSKISHKLNAMPVLTMGATFYLMMATAAFNGWIYTHSVVMGSFWLFAALLNIFCIIVFTRKGTS